MGKSKKASYKFVPRLRFPEFKDAGEWEEKNLGDTCNICTGKKDVNEGAIDGLYPFFTCAENHIFSNTYSFNTEAILVAGNANVGQAKYFKGKFEAYQRTYVLTDFINSVTPLFLYSELKWNLYNSLINHVQVSAMSYIRLPMLQGYRIVIPLNMKEQQKIAFFFSSLDELITAHEQKLDSLKAYRKGLMQQLFPATGKSVPKLRFPEYCRAGEWEERPIGDMLFETSRPIVMEDEKDYSLVTVKRRYGGIVSRGIYKGNSIAVKSQFLLHEGDFLISKRQIVHNACGIVPKEFQGSIVSNEYSILSAKKCCDIHFFNYFAQQSRISESFLLSSIGIHIEKMLFKLNDWLKRKFLFPSLLEQRRTVNVLSSADNLIACQETMLDALKDHKKALMQQLFPITNEVSNP
jgi:type I restriction enzyme, S subunit